MEPIFIALVSIYAIGGLAALVNAIAKKKVVCPVCAGVSSTWILILVGIFSGRLVAENWASIAVLLIGGSVVGIVYQLERKMVNVKSFWKWKLFFMPLGFLLGHSIVFWRLARGLTTLGILLLGYALCVLLNQKTISVGANELKDKMKDCC